MNNENTLTLVFLLFLHFNFIIMNITTSHKFQQKMLNPFFFNFFLLLKLPMAFLSGMKLKELSGSHSVVKMKYKYLNKNPFGSIYFACLSMAGELSSGILAASFTYKSSPKISMLVVGMEVEFTKKAVGVITFTCNQGQEINDTIQRSIETGEGQTIEAITIANDESGEKVAEFKIRWSFKSKS